MQFQTVNPEDAEFAELSRNLDAIASQQTFNYNGAIEAYNSLKVRGKVWFPYDKSKSSNLVSQLKSRGLSRDQDYKLVFAMVPGEEKGSADIMTAFLERLSAVEGKLLQVGRGPRNHTPEQKAAALAKRLDTLAKKKAGQTVAAAVGAAPAPVPAPTPAPAAAPAAKSALAKSADKKPAGKK